MASTADQISPFTIQRIWFGLEEVSLCRFWPTAWRLSSWWQMWVEPTSPPFSRISLVSSEQQECVLYCSETLQSGAGQVWDIHQDICPLIRTHALRIWSVMGGGGVHLRPLVTTALDTVSATGWFSVTCVGPVWFIVEAQGYMWRPSVARTAKTVPLLIYFMSSYSVLQHTSYNSI